VRIEAKRSGAARSAGLCAAALLVTVLSLAALAQGCAQHPGSSGGETAAQTQPLLVQSTPASTPAQAASPTPPVKSPLPPPKGFVNDFAGVIDIEAGSQLEARLRRLKARANIEIGVVTVETTGGQDIFDYSLAVARGWGIGPPDGEDGGGLLLLFAVKDRKWRLQVSDRLRADLPDDVAAKIAGVMTPSLLAGRYGEAATRCVDGLIKRLAERRGFSMEEEELILQGLPEERPKPAERPKAGERRKSEPRRKP
jgi:hypothetical protein